MKVLFLDIDGVVQPFNLRDNIVIYKDVRCVKFNKKSVKVLNEIIDKTDCEIVISSDWRHHYDLEGLQIIFEFNGIKKVPIDTTEIEVYTNAIHLEDDRVIEIKNWLKKNKVEKFCVVDDMNLDIENFVHCNRTYNEGIKQTGIKEKIIKILNNGISN